MKKWLYVTLLSAASTAGNAGFLYLGFSTFDPAVLRSTEGWWALGMSIGLAVIKDIFLHLKDAPKFFDGLPPQEPPKG